MILMLTTRWHCCRKHSSITHTNTHRTLHWSNDVVFVKHHDNTISFMEILRVAKSFPKSDSCMLQDLTQTKCNKLKKRKTKFSSFILKSQNTTPCHVVWSTPFRASNVFSAQSILFQHHPIWRHVYALLHSFTHLPPPQVLTIEVGCLSDRQFALDVATFQPASQEKHQSTNSK